MLFPIKQNGKEGFIDISGNIIIKPQFDEVGFFSEGLASIKKGINMVLLIKLERLLFLHNLMVLAFSLKALLMSELEIGQMGKLDSLIKLASLSSTLNLMELDDLKKASHILALGIGLIPDMGLSTKQEKLLSILSLIALFKTIRKDW